MATHRGRKSTAELTSPKAGAAVSNVLQIDGGRIKPPDGMTKLQLEQWHLIVKSLPADYFHASDAPLLRAYCAAQSLYLRASDQIDAEGLVKTSDKGREYAHPAAEVMKTLGATLTQLSMRLRLAPSTRMDPRTAGGKAKDDAPRNEDGEEDAPWGAAA